MKTPALAGAETDWLQLLTPYSSNGKGQLFKPEVGSRVLIGYQGGLAEQPFVMGNFFHAHNKQGAKYSPAQNSLKGIQTAGGNKFVMQEQAGAQTILISNSNNKDTAVDIGFNGDGSINITTNGPINLTAGKDITLQAGKSITLQANEDINLIAKRRVGVEAQDEHVAVRARKELLLTAVEGDMTLEAAAKKMLVKAADNAEIIVAAAAPPAIRAQAQAGQLSARQWDEYLKMYTWHVAFSQLLTLTYYRANFLSGEYIAEPETREMAPYVQAIGTPQVQPVPSRLSFSVTDEAGHKKTGSRWAPACWPSPRAASWARPLSGPP